MDQSYGQWDEILDIVHYVDNFLSVCHIVPACIGIPVNLLLIGTIVSVKRFHLPRNFAWLGVGISNICLLTSYMVANIVVRLNSTSSTRSFCTWLAIISVTNQSLNFVLFQGERIIFMYFPRWHLRYLSVAWIAAIQLGCSLLIFAIGIIENFQVFADFVFQFFSSQSFIVVGSLTTGLLPIFLIGQMIIMGNKTKKHYPSVEVVCIKPRRSSCPGQQVQNRLQSYHRKRHFVLIGKQRVSAIDIDAAQNVFFMGKVYFFATIFPKMVLFCLVSICLQLSSPSRADATCMSFIQAFYYLSGLLCIHSGIVNPIIFAYYSDLKSAIL